MYGESEVKHSGITENEDGVACCRAVSIVQQWSNQLQVSKHTSIPYPIAIKDAGFIANHLSGHARQANVQNGDDSSLP
jgi:hypothetical protein